MVSQNIIFLHSSMFYAVCLYVDCDLSGVLIVSTR